MSRIDPKSQPKLQPAPKKDDVAAAKARLKGTVNSAVNQVASIGSAVATVAVDQIARPLRKGLADSDKVSKLNLRDPSQLRVAANIARQYDPGTADAMNATADTVEFATRLPGKIERFQKAYRRKLANQIWQEPGAAGDQNVAQAGARLNAALDAASDRVQQIQRTVERSRKELPQRAVKPGESLSSIAKELGRDWHDIYELNKTRIKDPNFLTPGTKLTLPTKRDEATAKAEAASLGTAEGIMRQAQAAQGELKNLR